ncbi:MAG: hypothetical protein ABIA78_02930 [archaeon]
MGKEELKEERKYIGSKYEDAREWLLEQMRIERVDYNNVVRLKKKKICFVFYTSF